MPLVGMSPSTTLMLMKASHHHHAGDAHSQQAAKGVLRAERGTDSAPKENSEQQQNHQGTEQPQFLCGHGEDEISVGARAGKRASASLP